MKTKIHSAGKGAGGLHLTTSKNSFGRSSTPDRPKFNGLRQKGPKIVLGKGNQGSSSLRGK